MNLLASFNFSACYSQIFISDLDSAGKLSDWSKQHTAQGFNWSLGYVSFGTISDGLYYLVEVWQASEVCLYADAVRAVLVPFCVGCSETVLVTDVFNSTEEEIHILEGGYALVFETGFREEYGNDFEYMWCRLTFIPGGSAQSEILRADPDLSPSYPLLMEAESSVDS